QNQGELSVLNEQTSASASSMPLPGDDQVARALLGEIEQMGDRLVRVRRSIGQVIYGQKDVIDLTLTTLMAGGHLLLVGVPGLAKTRLLETLGVVLGPQ